MRKWKKTQAEESQPYLSAGGVEVEVAVASLLRHGEILRARLGYLQRNSLLLQRDGCARTAWIPKESSRTGTLQEVPTREES